MAYSDVKLDTDEKKGVAVNAGQSALSTALSGAAIGAAVGGPAAPVTALAGALIGAAAGLGLGGALGAISSTRQAKAEKALEQDIAKQQKEARADQLAINRSSQARQELRDRKSQQYMFQPEDEVFLNATGGGSGYDRFMRSKYGA